MSLTVVVKFVSERPEQLSEICSLYFVFNV